MPAQRELDIAYLLMAKTWAERMSKAERQKNGAFIVKNDQIISDGYNGTPEGFDNCCEFQDRDETKPEVLHAESNAILKLARSTASCEGATLYVTTAPCFHCAKMIIQARIKRVVFLNEYRLPDGVRLLHYSRKLVEVYHLKLDQKALSSHSQLVRQAFV